jgi:hypothetical protein
MSSHPKRPKLASDDADTAEGAQQQRPEELSAANVLEMLRTNPVFSQAYLHSMLSSPLGFGQMLIPAPLLAAQFGANSMHPVPSKPPSPVQDPPVLVPTPLIARFEHAYHAQTFAQPPISGGRVPLRSQE